VPTGGTGEPFTGIPLLSAAALTAEQSWILLMAALADSGSDDEARRLFAETARSVEDGAKPDAWSVRQ
jgi:hypothetical protein